MSRDELAAFIAGNQAEIDKIDAELAARASRKAGRRRGVRTVRRAIEWKVGVDGLAVTGNVRELLMKRIRQAELALKISDWLAVLRPLGRAWCDQTRARCIVKRLTEYLERAVKFEELAASEPEPALRAQLLQ
ncbi:hypothetical protein [Bradyrhizobium sp. USDA 4486]